jgi:LemA protein
VIDSKIILIILIISIVITLTSYFIIVYNRLIALKNEVHKNWSNIEVLLKQRNSELTKLLDSCKEYMKYEQETFEKIIKARNSLTLASDNKDLSALGKAEIELRMGFSKLLALAENYPDLKTNTVFINLQHRISELEESISDRREFYNESVNLNNITIEQFPSNIIAHNFGFKDFELLKFNDEETKDIRINFDKK